MADQPDETKPELPAPTPAPAAPKPRRITRSIPMGLVQNINASLDALNGAQRNALTGAIERHLHAARALAEQLTINALTAPLPAPPAEPAPAPAAPASGDGT